MSNRTYLYIALGVMAILAMAAASGPWHTYISDGPNIVLIISDDQSMDTLPHSPAAMPYLQSRMLDREDHWVNFSRAFVNNPLCCPSRATILSGQFSHHTGVLKNAYGKFFSESSTVATWLHDVGYQTGFFGKYINQYPFDRAPYVPPGWDEWAVKFHGGVETVYFNYRLAEGEGEGAAELIPYGDDEDEYMPDVLAAKTVDFIRNAPGGRPFFAVYSPTSPHSPWVPAPRHAGAFADLEIGSRPNVNEMNVDDKPTWVQGLNPMPENKVLKLQGEQRAEFEALLAMDEAVESITAALEERDVMDDTVIIYLSDNGYSYGSHRWVAKRCVYAECTQIPMLIRYPGASAHDDAFPVSNVDVAPTIAGLAGVAPGIPVDGVNLVPLLARDRRPDRPGVLLEWPGDETVPSYFGIRTYDYLYVELGTGERELYDLTGEIGEPDPYEFHNVVNDERYDLVRLQLAAQLTALTDQ